MVVILDPLNDDDLSFFKIIKNFSIKDIALKVPLKLSLKLS